MFLLLLSIISLFVSPNYICWSSTLLKKLLFVFVFMGEGKSCWKCSTVISCCLYSSVQPLQEYVFHICGSQILNQSKYMSYLPQVSNDDYCCLLFICILSLKTELPLMPPHTEVNFLSLLCHMVFVYNLGQYILQI